MTESLQRPLRLIKSTLKVSLRRDVRQTDTGKLLLSKGYISKKTGLITEKGKVALRVL